MINIMSYLQRWGWMILRWTCLSWRKDRVRMYQPTRSTKRPQASSIHALFHIHDPMPQVRERRQVVMSAQEITYINRPPHLTDHNYVIRDQFYSETTCFKDPTVRLRCVCMTPFLTSSFAVENSFKVCLALQDLWRPWTPCLVGHR